MRDDDTPHPFPEEEPTPTELKAQPTGWSPERADYEALRVEQIRHGNQIAELNVRFGQFIQREMSRTSKLERFVALCMAFWKDWRGS